MCYETIVDYSGLSGLANNYAYQPFVKKEPHVILPFGLSMTYDL